MLQTKDLIRNFGKFVAVDGINFKADLGEVVGFLGPNGAGKSTTMKLITGFLTPTSGEIEINGVNITKNPLAAKRLTGYLPENAPLYGEMTPIQFLTFVCNIKKVTNPILEIKKIVEITALNNVLSQKIETLSKGFKRRVGLAQALIGDPKLLILDEPTDGLDPNQKYEVRKLINNLAKDKCIIISTHILEEVEAVCTRAIVISSGKIVADSTPELLKNRSKHKGEIIIRSEDLVKHTNFSDLDKFGEVSIDNEKLTIKPKNSEIEFAKLVNYLELNKIKITDLKISGGELDDVFRELTNGSEIN